MIPDELILRFFREDIGGILITDGDGRILCEDEKTAFVRLEKTNWMKICPPPRADQKGERWELVRSDSSRTYLVVTSTLSDGQGMKQIHHLVDTSEYTDLYRNMSEYSRSLQSQRDRDGLTGLYNKGKFMEMKRTLFRNQDEIAVFNMDLNGLKIINDSRGHETGDRLIRKTAESLKRIEARNIIPFRVGGDEFLVIAIHVNREGAAKIRQDWENALAELNRAEDDLPCTVACGFAFGEKNDDLDEVLALADRRMYEDKKRLKD